jgi:hypothetical protein
MDPQTFAAARAARLTAADEELEPFVRDSLENLIAGNPDWTEDVVTAASVLWLEHFKAEAPHADGEKRMAEYQESLIEALEKTSDPGFEVEDSQVTRITYWLSGYTVNHATVGGVAARGGKHKRWVSHHDDAVRENHENTDGQTVPIGATFTVGGFHLHFPGEPIGPPEIWINCRCLAMPAAREGDAMSANTFVLGPEDPIEVDNPDIVTSDDLVMAAAAVDETDIAVEPPDEEDLIADEPEEGEELITEIPVHGVLAPEGVATGDGREFAIGALSTRQLPIPLRYETVSTHGGQTSDVVTIGRVDEAWRDDATDMWRWKGAVVLTKPFAQEAIDGMVDGTVRGVSIDGDDAEIQVEEMSGEGDDIMDAILDMMNPDKTVFSKMRVAGLTIVPIPAFQEAYIALGHEFQEDLTDAQVDEQFAVLAACGCMSPESEPEFRDVSPEERDRLAGEGAAMPDGSFPIANCEDLQNAIQAIGRANDPDAVKAHIRKRKSALGCDEVELPDTWAIAAGALVELNSQDGGPVTVHTYAPGTHDGPGWITHPIPTARIRRYWVKGEGAAKIAWGAPGDFNRCRMQLAKYVQNPDWLAGLCANMHKEALGIWPAQHHGSKVITASASVAERAPAARLVEPAHPVYPAEFFSEPTLDRAFPLKIDRETRRIQGYVSEWGVCHVGITGFCQEVPRSYTDYAYFKKGVIDTDQGEQFVGCLTWGGHATRTMSMSRASEFYDKPEAVRAFVNVGENAFGVWYSGIIPPDVTDDDITKMRAIGAVSGDWREVRGALELIGVPVVNTPGLPVRQLAASAGRQTVMIGAGALKPDPVLVAAATVGMDPELVAGIARTAVAEYRHQEKIAARAEPARAKVRERRLAAARARVERD